MAQGRSINTINRASGKAIAKQLAAEPDTSKDPLEATVSSSSKTSSKSSPSTDKKDKKSKRGTGSRLLCLDG